MPDIEIRHFLSKRRREKTKIFSDGVEAGSLDYLPPLRSLAPAELGFLFVHPNFRGEGLSSVLLKEFCRDVGRATNVKSIVTHPETREYLKRYRPVLGPSTIADINITDPGIMDDIPITKILRAGGIGPIKFRVSYNSDDATSQSGSYIYRVGFKGVII